MIITLPQDWVIPDDQTGSIPTIQAGLTGNTWVEIVNYWNSIGYFMQVGNGPTIDLVFPPGWLKEKNAMMTVPWWEALCDTANVPNGNVTGWQAVWQVHPSVYDQGLVPLTIPNSTYFDQTDPDNPVEVQRLWKQWGSPNHTHYYLPLASPQEGLTEDRYLIPTWSWGTNIEGIEMMYGQNESGVNIVSREDFQQVLNAELLETVPITPTT